MKNWKRMRKAILICGSSMIIALYSGGCFNNKAEKQADAHFFASCDEVRDTQRIAHVQAAAGARQDATLLPYHFDKGELNSLGRQKLSLMLDDDASNNPIIIYINVPASDEFKAARQDAVVAYLKDQGLEESQISFRPGPNPDAHMPASEGLSRLSKTETGGAGGSSSSAGNPSQGQAPSDSGASSAASVGDSSSSSH